MYKLTVFLILLILVIHVSEAGTYGRNYGNGGSSRSSSYIGKRNGYFIQNAQTNQNQYDPSLNQQNSLNANDPPNLSEHGLSLWALILIMIAVIVAGFSIYYGVICYPFLCKNEKTYQFMEVSSTITGATSRSIQSIENFQPDHKH